MGHVRSVLAQSRTQTLTNLRSCRLRQAHALSIRMRKQQGEDYGPAARSLEPDTALQEKRFLTQLQRDDSSPL